MDAPPRQPPPTQTELTPAERLAVLEAVRDALIEAGMVAPDEAVGPGPAAVA